MNKIPMKKIIITLDEMNIERLDKIIKHLNDCPEEGGGWNRSRVIRAIIYKEYKDMKSTARKKAEGGTDQES